MNRSCLALTIILIACGRAPSPPRTVVPWAWERREDLRFTHAAEVAYLAATIRIDGEHVTTLPRMQPLRVAPGARVIPVVRIEARRIGGLDRVTDDIVRVAKGASMIQIDFDATLSQRTYYASLLRALRTRLDPGTRISITALASWCSDDRWLNGLPIDEAVPMLFRMGREASDIRARLARGDDWSEPRCRTSLGIATDEPLDRVPAAGRRVYVFHTKHWDAAAWQTAQKEIDRWE